MLWILVYFGIGILLSLINIGLWKEDLLEFAKRETGNMVGESTLVAMIYCAVLLTISLWPLSIVESIYKSGNNKEKV